MDEEEVYKALEIILKDKKSHNTSLYWAVNYAAFGMKMKGDELATQCLYVLGNITGWRHPQAKEVRNVLKKFSK
jgi:hypothetical protein